MPSAVHRALLVIMLGLIRPGDVQVQEALVHPSKCGQDLAQARHK